MLSTMLFQIEAWADCQPEIAALCVRHWEEIAHNRDLIKLDPDWDKYQKLAQMQMLSVATARVDGILVGYQIYIVAPHMHYRQSLTALSDVLYLAPEYRQGRAGIRLMQCAEEELKRLNVQRIVQNVKVTNDWSKILERMGYKPFEYIYTKLLGV
jgi:GNAT superfamily N-acetyltransferase